VVRAQLDLPLVAEVSVGRLFYGSSISRNGREEMPFATSAAADVEDAAAAAEVVPLMGAPGKLTVFDLRLVAPDGGSVWEASEPPDELPHEIRARRSTISAKKPGPCLP
jgi:hypothetical protein